MTASAHDEPTGEEVRNINVPFPASVHSEMRQIKDWHNLAWWHVIVLGIESLADPADPDAEPLLKSEDDPFLEPDAEL